jgi:protein TonB
MLFIISAHIAAVAVLMSVKLELPTRPIEPPFVVQTIQPKRPEPVDLQVRPDPAPRTKTGSTFPDLVVPIPSDPTTTADPLPQLPGPGEPGPITEMGPADAFPIAATPAVLLTDAALLKPPYPASKLAVGEEADLKVRLTIDAAGKVISVAPVGRADSTFLAAARRHILAHWRYRPAMHDGHGVATTLVITLRFRLDD